MRTLTKQQIKYWFATSYAGGGVEPEITAYTEGLTTPLSSSQVTKLNTLVLDIKTGLSITALSDAFDVFYVLGNETAEAALRNLVKRAHDAEAVNSPTFTALEGFTGDGLTSYIDTNYVPSASAVNYTQNDASFGLYIRNNVAETNGHGVLDTTNLNDCLIFPRNAAGTTIYRINDATSASATGTTSSAGIFILQRTASNDKKLFRNNILLGSSATLSTGIPQLEFYLCAVNENGEADFHSINQLSVGWGGKSFSETERQVIQDAIEKYMDSNEKGVIS